MSDASPSEIAQDQIGLIVGTRDDDVEELLAGVVADFKADGIHIGGVYQTSGGDCAKQTMALVDILTGEHISLSQKLGACSTGCALDPAGLAQGAAAVHAAREAGVELIVANKYSTRETEGDGLLGEMFEALAEGFSLLTIIHPDRKDEWTKMSGGVGVFLAPEKQAIRSWWQARQA